MAGAATFAIAGSRIERRYFIRRIALTPEVDFRVTDHRREPTLRSIVRDHGSREPNDATNGEILTALDGAGICIARSTFDLVGPRPLWLERAARTDG